MSYASNKNAYGICDISGFRYRLKDMRKTWDGLLVGPDQYDPKHPQLQPRHQPVDAEALRDPRPNTDFEVGQGKILTTEDNIIGSLLLGTFSTGQVGAPSIEIDIPRNIAYLSSQTATTSVGSVVINENESNVLTGQAATAALGTVSVTSSLTTYTVTVASYLGANYFYIDGSRAATLSLTEGETYRFDQSDGTNSGHPLRFSTTSNGTHGGGSEYTTGVTTNGTPGSSGAYTQITVAVGAPTLYYYCTNHSGMGGTINT